jgi:hypothetical protein
MGLLSKLFRGDQVNDYFFDAVVVFISNSDPVARLAALAAAKVAAKSTRASMVEALRLMAHEAYSMKAHSIQALWDSLSLDGLADEISLRDWSIRDSMAGKRDLMKLNADYCKALNGFDGEFFRKRFPHLFKQLPPYLLSYEDDILNRGERR